MQVSQLAVHLQVPFYNVMPGLQLVQLVVEVQERQGETQGAQAAVPLLNSLAKQGEQVKLAKRAWFCLHVKQVVLSLQVLQPEVHA
jgi:hypothetical protein